MLTAIGWTYDYLPDSTREEIKSMLTGYDGLIVRSKTRIDRDLVGENPTLKFIARAGAGIDDFDLIYLREKNISVIHAAEGNRDAVGEYTIGALLALMRNIPRADHQVRNMQWLREENRGEEIMGKTVSLIGYGNMGRSFARRLKGFECKVLAYDKYKRNFSDDLVKESGEEELFEETDILSLHIPLTTETRFMVDISYINRFKKKIILVNTSRGEIVSLAGLIEGFEAGRIKGAVLDVLENEKLKTLNASQKQSFDNLIKKTDVIFTPHIAGWTYESHVKINVALTQKIEALKLA
jgi:D-3-phosphoglycerate dehydrogenase